MQTFEITLSFSRLFVFRIVPEGPKILLHRIHIRPDQELNFDFGGGLSDLSLVLKRGGILELKQLPLEVHCIISSTGMISTAGQKLITHGALTLKAPILDNSRGSIKTKSLNIKASFWDNQQGLVQVQDDCTFEIKTLLDNTEGSIFAGHTINAWCKGFLHNRAGRILALAQDSTLILKSEKTIRYEHFGRIAGISDTQIQCPSFQLTDPLWCDNLSIKAQKLWLFSDLCTRSGTIDLQGQSLFQAPHTTLGSQSDQSTIALDFKAIDAKGHWGPKGHFKIKALEDGSLAKTVFAQSIDLDLHLIAHRDIAFSEPMTLKTFTLRVEAAAHNTQRYTLHFQESLMVEEGMQIEATQSHLKIADSQNQDLKQLRTKKGPLSLQAFDLEMPFAALYGVGPVMLKTQGPVILGVLEEPVKISHLRSDTSIHIETQDQLRTYHVRLDVQGNFHLKAPHNWHDVGGSTFIFGIACLETPLHEHRIKTKTLSYAENKMANVLNPHGVRNGITTAILADASPPIFMAQDIEASGETKMVGGPLYAAHFKGTPPITEAFTESYQNHSETKYGHRKEHKAQWYGGTQDWKGKTFLSSFGTHSTTFEYTTLQLPGIVRASCLKLLSFKDCLIGSFENRALSALKKFEPCLDLIHYARPNTALEESTEDAPSLLSDCLALHPSIPPLPRVIAGMDGLTLQSDIKPLYPWSEEKKLIAMAFLSAIAQLPPEYGPCALDLERLGFWLMNNTLEWMRGLRPEEQCDSLALMKHNLLCYPLKPLLLYTSVDYENQEGLIRQVLKPMLVLPKSYEKLYVQPGGHLLAQRLWMEGAKDAQLTITHGVEGVKLLSVEVDHIHLETVPYVWEETLRQAQSTRHFLRKHTQHTDQVVRCSKVQTVATLATEGKLHIKAKTLKQVGAVIQGGLKTSTLQIGSHTAEPVFEHSIQGYEVLRRRSFSKAHVQGALLTTHILPSRLGVEGPIKAQIEQADYCAFSVKARHKLHMVFQNLKLYPFVMSQPLAPQITQHKQCLVIHQDLRQSATVSAFKVEQGVLFLKSKGKHHSVASHYEAPRGIILKAKHFSEDAQILSYTSKQHRLGVEGFSGVVSDEISKQESVQRSCFKTDPNAQVIIFSEEGAKLVAPQLQTHTFRLGAVKGDAALKAVSLAFEQVTHTERVGLELSTKPGVFFALEQGQEQAMDGVGADLQVHTMQIYAGQNILLEAIASEAKRMMLKASNTVLISGAPVYRNTHKQNLECTLGFDFSEGVPYVGVGGGFESSKMQSFVPSTCHTLEHLQIEAQTLYLKNGVDLQSKQVALKAKHILVEAGIEAQEDQSFVGNIDSTLDLKSDYRHVRHQSQVLTGIYTDDGKNLVQAQNIYAVDARAHQDKHHSIYLPVGLILAAFRRRSKGLPPSLPQAGPTTPSSLSQASSSLPFFTAANDSITSQQALPFSDALMVSPIAANSDYAPGLLRQAYEKIDAFFQESHRLMLQSEQGTETLYRQHPSLRFDAAQHAAGFAQFRSIVPKDTKDLALKAASLVGGPKALKGSVQSMQWLYGQAKVGYRLKTLDAKAEISHIFSKAKGGLKPRHGHLADTPENRRLIVETFSNAKYFKGVDSHGKAWWLRELPDRRQCWVFTQNGRVKSGGINEVAQEGPARVLQSLP